MVLRSRGAVLAVTGVLLLAGCAGGNGDDDRAAPSADASSSTSTAASSPTPSRSSEPAPTRAAPIPKEPVDGKLIRGRSTARSAEERAVADAWYAYWAELVRMFRTGDVDRDALSAVAVDTAASNALQYVAEMKRKGHRQTGGVIGAITEIRVDGDTATIAGCFRNTTVDVNRDGQWAESLDPFFTTRDVLRRDGQRWRLTKQVSGNAGDPCDYR